MDGEELKLWFDDREDYYDNDDENDCSSCDDGSKRLSSLFVADDVKPMMVKNNKQQYSRRRIVREEEEEEEEDARPLVSSPPSSAKENRKETTPGVKRRLPWNTKLQEPQQNRPPIAKRVCEKGNKLPIELVISGPKQHTTSDDRRKFDRTRDVILSSSGGIHIRHHSLSASPQTSTSSNKTRTSPFENLPTELLVNIFWYLDGFNLARAAMGMFPMRRI